MSLRTRIALLVAAVVAVMVAVVGFLAVNAAESELTDEVDQDLLSRVRLLERPSERDDDWFRGLRRPGIGPDAEIGPPGSTIGELLRLDPFGFLVAFDAYAQVVVDLHEVAPGAEIDPDAVGEVVLSLDEDFTHTPNADTLRHARRHGRVIETVREHTGRGHTSLRMVTVAVADGFYLQLARPLDEVERAVEGLRRQVVLFGALAVAAAAAAAWLLAGRAVRPIVRLTETAEHITRTGDLERPVEGSGSGEVGRMARSFRTMLNALSASRRQQHRLVVDASHELRTPLTSLRTNVDVLRKTPDLPDDERSAVLDDIDAELIELSDLSAELVDLATDVRIDEELTLVELADLTETVAARARLRSGRDVVVVVERGVAVEGRANALTRAIRNLLDNALKFSDSGPVEVVVSGGALTVHDSGPGIPEADRSRIFERFHRLDSTRDRPGSGLGLAIVAQVAEAHGGSVDVGSSHLGGAAVTLQIPEIDP